MLETISVSLYIKGVFLVTRLDTSKRIHDVIVALDIVDSATFKSGRTKITVTKVSGTDYTIKTDKVCITVMLTEETAIITKYREQTTLSACVQRGVLSFLYQLFEKLRKI